jgi:F420H(2)-dependent quinone reductase
LAWLYQYTDGRVGGRVQGLPVLRLMTHGRRTGRLRSTLLGYFEHDGAFVVTASNAGFDRHPGWYHNLTADPKVELQLRDRRFAATAERAGPDLRNQLWAALIRRAPGYAAYQTRTERVIPMILLRPLSPRI